MKRKLAWFLAGCLAIWIVTGIPAWLIWGEVGLIDSLAAWTVCVVPMLGTFVWSQLAFQGAPEIQIAATLGGTGVRIVVVVALGVLLFTQVPALNHQGFLFAVIAYYLATLLLEVLMLVSDAKDMPASSGPTA